MAEGDLHRRLVDHLHAYMIETSGSELACCVDGPVPAVTATPPLLAGYRPDVYAVTHDSRRVLLGEAKTPGDIDNRHTRAQLGAYFEHLLDESRGEIWIAVPLTSAGTALRVCRSVRSRLGATQVPLVITSWLLGTKPFVEVWRG